MGQPVLLITIALLLVPIPLRADTVELPASRDNTLYQQFTGHVSNGVGEHLFAGRTGGGAMRRALIAFDIAGSIPPGSRIDSVVLTLQMSRTQAGPQWVALRRVRSDWGEGDSDAPGGEGGGAAATAGDATWDHTFFNDRFWGFPGGDFSGALSALVEVDQATSYSWGSTERMVLDVQGWVESPATNFGWILVGNEGTFPTAKRFDSRENASPAARPRLTVEFTPGAAPPRDPRLRRRGSPSRPVVLGR